MKLNPLVRKKLTDAGIIQDDAILYLLSLYYELDVSYIPTKLMQLVHRAGIIGMDPSTRTLQWKIPLFEGHDPNFEWVTTEYLSLFAPFKMENKYKRECVARMKQLFATHPDIRKDDVLNATRLFINHHISRRSASQYVRAPHYFIRKDKGGNATSDLLSWIDEYRATSMDDISPVATSKSNKMQ